MRSAWRRLERTSTVTTEPGFRPKAPVIPLGCGAFGSRCTGSGGRAGFLSNSWCFQFVVEPGGVLVERLTPTPRRDPAAALPLARSTDSDRPPSPCVALVGPPPCVIPLEPEGLTDSEPGLVAEQHGQREIRVPFAVESGDECRPLLGRERIAVFLVHRSEVRGSLDAVEDRPCRFEIRRVSLRRLSSSVGPVLPEQRSQGRGHRLGRDR